MDWIGKKKLKRFFSELEFADRKCCTIRRWTIYLSEYNLSSIFNIRHLGCLRSVYAITSPWQFMVCVLYMLHLMVVYDQCTLNASPYCCLWSLNLKYVTLVVYGHCTLYQVTNWQFMVIVLYMLYLMVVYDQCTLYYVSNWQFMVSVLYIMSQIGSLWSVYSICFTSWSFTVSVLYITPPWQFMVIVLYNTSPWQFMVSVLYITSPWQFMASVLYTLHLMVMIYGRCTL